MDDQTRSIIRNVKGPGTKRLPPAHPIRNPLERGRGHPANVRLLQSVRTTSYACSSPNVRPEGCVKKGESRKACTGVGGGSRMLLPGFGNDRHFVAGGSSYSIRAAFGILFC